MGSSRELAVWAGPVTEPTSSSSPAAEDSQSGGAPAGKHTLPDRHTRSGALGGERTTSLASINAKFVQGFTELD